MRVRSAAFVLAGACCVASCTTTVVSSQAPPARDDGVVVSVSPPTTVSSPPTPDPSTTEAAATGSSTTSTTTTTTEPGLDVFDPQCVVEVQPGDSLTAVVTARADEILTVKTLQAENGLTSDHLDPGQLLDVCIDNGLDDVTGEQRLERNAAVVASETADAVMAQQARLNELFTPLGYPEMPVDGDSGPVTRRALCATRLVMGFPVNRSDMDPGGVEEAFLLALPALTVPADAGTAGRWIFIDLTCQVMFVGEGNSLAFVFPTSTGEPEHATRRQERSRIFRFNPALENNGWHNSSTYPVAADNPLNGNMYKPLYFDRGQAIHGANSVPTSPQSKGCARLRPAHHDALIAWLGLSDVSGPVGTNRINATVAVRGDFALG